MLLIILLILQLLFSGVSDGDLVYCWGASAPDARETTGLPPVAALGYICFKFSEINEFWWEFLKIDEDWSAVAGVRAVSVILNNWVNFDGTKVRISIWIPAAPHVDYCYLHITFYGSEILTWTELIEFAANSFFLVGKERGKCCWWLQPSVLGWVIIGLTGPLMRAFNGLDRTSLSR